MSQDPVQVVMKMFELSLKRDVEGLKAMALPDCTLETTFPAHLPIGGKATGPEDCAALLLRIGEPFDMLNVEVKEIVAQGETVLIYAQEHLRAKSTGKTTMNNSLSLVKVRDGKFVSSQVFPDTFAVCEILRPDEPAPALTATAAAATSKKSAAGARKKNTLKASAKKAGARKNTLKAAKKGKSAAGGKKKTARARA
jgi:ketosteroid isomerase-like protein